MNTHKLNIVLGAVFAVLTILSVIKFASSSSNYVDYSEVPRLIPGFTPQNVHTILLEKGAPTEEERQAGTEPEQLIRLDKAGEQWYLRAQEYGPVQLKAMSSQVEDRILKRIEKLEVTVSTVVTTDAKDADLEKYGFGSESWTITCYDAGEKELAKIRIGRQTGREGDEYDTKVRGSFVKRADQETILISDQPFELYEKPGEWLDKQVLSIEESEVARIHLQNEKGELILERVEKKKDDAKGEDTKDQDAQQPDAAPEPTWKVVRGPEGVGKLRDYAVTTLIARATNVTAKEFLTPATQQAMQAAGLMQPRIRVTVRLRDDSKTEKSIVVGERVEGEQAYQAHAGDVQMVFSLPEWDVAEFEKDPKDFFDALPQAQPAGGDEPKKEGQPGEGGQKGEGGQDAPEQPDPQKQPGEDAPKDAPKDTKKEG